MPDPNSAQDNSVLQSVLESQAVQQYQKAQATPQQVANKMTAFPSSGDSPPPSPQAVQQESQKPGPLKMSKVSSSTIELVGYDPKGQTLHIQFKSGPSTYIYSGVSSKKFSEFMAAHSKGLFHANEIKGKFKFQKVKPTPPQL